MPLGIQRRHVTSRVLRQLQLSRGSNRETVDPPKAFSCCARCAARERTKRRILDIPAGARPHLTSRLVRRGTLANVALFDTRGSAPVTALLEKMFDIKFEHRDSLYLGTYSHAILRRPSPRVSTRVSTFDLEGDPAARYRLL